MSARDNPAVRVGILVPFRFGDDKARDAAWAFVRSWYLHQHPGMRIYVGTCPPGAPWSKGAAVERAFRRAREDVLVIADADVVVDPAALTESIVSVAREEVPWAQPHSIVYRLSKLATGYLFDGSIGDVRPLGNASLERRAHSAAAGGGIVVVSRKAYEAVGGIDPRFEGWGGEDISFARALDTLVGECDRGLAVMWHCWHPRQSMRRGGRASAASEALAARYLDANGDVEKMCAIVEER